MERCTGSHFYISMRAASAKRARVKGAAQMQQMENWSCVSRTGHIIHIDFSGIL